jgi:peroxiredoxin
VQLVELQEARERFAREGLGLAAVTYDNEATLTEFSKAQKIEYPLLTDTESKIIRAYRVLDPDNSEYNRAGDGSVPGDMAYPGYFLIDRNGVIKEKFFENLYYERRTPKSVIANLFPELAEARGAPLSAPHLAVRTSQSDLDAAPGNRVTLIAEIQLPAGMHVYAPGVRGYRPVQLTLKPTRGFEPQAPQYPSSRSLTLPAIHQTVPVYEGRFRIRQDVFVGMTDRDFLISVRDSPGRSKTFPIAGVLSYQACDEKVCYPPSRVAMTWELAVKLRKMKPRASPENQRKP